VENSKNRIIKRFVADKRGQFGTVFAVLAVPMLALTTLALDHSFAHKEKVKLGNALDDTALASVLDQNLTDAERADYAKIFFSQFFDESENKNIDFKVLESGSSRVSLTAATKVPTSISAAFGKDHIVVSEKAVSELTHGSVVCMLALDPDGERSFEVAHGAVFGAQTCSVQVNSTHKEAAIVHEGSKAGAKDFCISGGATGDYSPFANTECRVIADPFEHRRIPGPGDCIPEKKLRSKLDYWLSEVHHPLEYWDWRTEQLVYEEGGVTLEPGTYCGGLTLKRKNIRFAPGEYIIKDGPLFFDEGTKAFGEEVTFVFAGKQATLQIDLGSKVDLSAPAKGDLQGLVFAQYIEKELGKDAALPSAESIIRSGGNLRLVGTAYMPTQRISFIGGSISSAQAPSTSFIAYNIRIDDGARISVAVDHQKAGLPPILPRSDESARLVE